MAASPLFKSLGGVQNVSHRPFNLSNIGVYPDAHELDPLVPASSTPNNTPEPSHPPESHTSQRVLPTHEGNQPSNEDASPVHEDHKATYRIGAYRTGITAVASDSKITSNGLRLLKLPLISSSSFGLHIYAKPITFTIRILRDLPHTPRIANETSHLVESLATEDVDEWVHVNRDISGKDCSPSDRGQQIMLSSKSTSDQGEIEDD